MLDGMLDAFDRLIQHFVKHFTCGHEHHFQSFSVVSILNQQLVFVGCSTSILNHSKRVAAQANDKDGLY